MLKTTGVASDELGRHLAEIDARAAPINDAQLVASARQVAELASSPSPDAKRKPKMTLPIIPVLVSCKGEVGLSSRLNLTRAWHALRDLARRSKIGDIGPEGPTQV